MDEINWARQIQNIERAAGLTSIVGYSALSPRPPAPKDWHPVGKRTPGPGQDFLSLEDRERLQGIKRKGNDVPPEDVLWLRKMVEELSILRRIDDWVFPKYAALVNHIAGNAFALRYDRRLDIQATTVRSGPEGIFTYLHHMMLLNVCEAALIVRPVIEVLEGSDQGRKQFLEGTLNFSVDGVYVLQENCRRHVLPGDSRRPHLFEMFDHKWICFGASPLDEQNQAMSDRNLGLFVPNGSDLRIEISTPLLEGDVTVRASVLAALYTTKP